MTHGYGPRYLHSTGQLHKGGPEHRRLHPGRRRHGRRAEDPRQPFGFGRLIRAQAAGDFASLQRARPPRRPRPHGGLCDAARDDRPRPDGRQHDDPPRRRPGTTMKTYDPGAESTAGVARGAARPARRAARLLADGAGRRRSPRSTFQELLDARRARRHDRRRRQLELPRLAAAASPRPPSTGSTSSTPASRAAIWGLEVGYCLMVGGDDEAGDAARADLHGARARATATRTSARPAPGTSRRWSTTGSSTA